MTASSLEVISEGGRAVMKTAKGSVPIPENVVGPVEWIARKQDFTGVELAAAFPTMSPDARQKLVQNLVGMRVLAPH